MTDDDPLDDDEFDERAEMIEVNVSDAWKDIMETQGFLRDDPFDWNVRGVSRYDNHHLEVYVGEPIGEYHEGDLVPKGLLAFMAGRGWQVTTIYIGQVPGGDEWVPCIGFSRGPDVFDALVNHGLSVTPHDDEYAWPPMQSGQPSERGDA